MKKDNIWAMYFSATGTTERVVTAIADRIAEGEAQRFDFTLPQARAAEKSFGPEDVVIFGTPVYAGRVPNVLLKYLETVRGNGALAVPVVLYGNRNFDDGLIELRNLLEKNGFRTIGAAGFIGEHSFSKILGAGRPDDSDMKLTEQFGDALKKKLEQKEIWQDNRERLPIAVRGEDPIRSYYQPRDRKGNPIDIRKVLPKTNEQCTNCGLCAKLCPMGSIDPQDVSQYTGICIKCGACIKKCPTQARYYDDAGYLYHQQELEEGYARRAEPELFL